MKQKRKNKFELSCRSYGKVSLALLSSVALALLCSVGRKSVAAETLDMSPLEAEVATKTSVKAYSTISVAVDAEINLELTPRSDGSFSSGNAQVTVGTNNTTGYAMYLRTIDGTQNLNAADANNVSKIGAIEGVLTANDFATNFHNRNTWGYALTKDLADSSTEYRAIPLPGEAAIISSDGTASADNYYLNIGAVVDSSLPAGEYRNSLVLSVVANPVAITGFKSIYYMQEMTAAVCESAEIHEEGELVDRRDNTIYQVAKLKDGNCWMTQNLALDLSADKTLTDADSDLPEGATYTPTSSTNTVSFGGVEVVTAPTDEYSWNMGKIVRSTPLSTEGCLNYGEINGSFNSAKFTDNLGVVCEDEGFVDVSGGNWKVGYHSTDGQSAISGNMYDPHYLVGNYYQFNALTAGTGADVNTNNANAVASICPKGWKLPESGVDSGLKPLAQKGVASYYNLLRAYGYPVASDYLLDDNDVSYTSLKHNVGQNELAAKPFYFVRGGGINLGFGYLTNVGVNAYYWSSTSNTAVRAYRLFFTSGWVRPAGVLGRALALSARCVAR